MTPSEYFTLDPYVFVWQRMSQISIYKERRLTAKQARSHFATRPSARTIARWCKDGFVVGSETIRLEHFTEGRAVVTTAEACDRFCQRIARLRKGDK